MHLEQLGVVVAIAIALHNIPEGMAIATPLYASGSSRKQAFKIALISGLSNPLGAMAAVLVLAPFATAVPAALAFAGGVMMFIALDELLPAAQEHGHDHYTALGIILGAAAMLVLLGMFNI